MSDLNKIKRILTELKPQLIEQYHVSSIGLFGSIVRDDYTAASDVDIIVDFDRPIGIEFINLANLIEHKIRKNVDLVSKNGIKKNYYQSIEPEIVYV